MYNLKISKEQAEVIVKALDLFSRVGICQFREILNHPTWRNKLMVDVSPQVRREIEYYIDVVKLLLTGYESGAGPSITVADEPNRVAYDILQVIEYELGKGEHNAMGVRSRPPMKWSDQELPEIIKEEE